MSSNYQKIITDPTVNYDGETNASDASSCLMLVTALSCLKHPDFLFFTPFSILVENDL